MYISVLYETFINIKTPVFMHLKTMALRKKSSKNGRKTMFLVFLHNLKAFFACDG